MMRTRTSSSAAALFSALALTLCLASCGFGGPTQKRWTEDVLLDDGSTVLIKRTVSYQESSAWGGGSYSAVEGVATLELSGAHEGWTVWSVPLIPMVLYRDSAASGQWVVVATTTSCEVWNARGGPVPPYWEYRLTDNGWKEAPLSESSLGRPANVFSGYTSLESKHVTVREQQAYRNDPRLGVAYRTINNSLVPRSSDFTCSHSK
jgi:hypothetical protein